MIVIGDVHGCLNTLKALIEKLPDQKNIIFVGDLIDRGPASSEVLDYVRSHGWRVVRGNHEDMLLAHFRPDVQTCPYPSRAWERNGGEPSLYRQDQIDWIASWPLFVELYEEVRKDGKHLFVSHAAPYYEDMERNLKLHVWFPDVTIIWNRSMPQPDEDRYYVFGHTPEAEAIVTEDYAMIDTGCAYSHRSKHLKFLTAFEFETGQLFTQENIDEMPDATSTHKAAD